MEFTVSGEDRRRVYTTALLLSLPFVVIAANSYIDQFFITQNGRTAVLAYTLALPIESMLLATGAVIAAVVSLRIKDSLAENNLNKARTHAIRSVVYSVPAAFLVIVVIMLAMNLVLDSFLDDQVGEDLDLFLTPFVLFFAVITLNSIICGIMVAQDLKRYYVACLLMSLVFNAVFDKIYVGYLDMGVFGNALGTLTGVAISLCTAFYALSRPGVAVPLSMKYFTHSKRDLFRLFREIRGHLFVMFVKYLSEFGIRLSLFTVYALTYGVPMLYVGLITVIGSAMSASLAFEFNRCYLKRDVGEAYAYFKHFISRGFLMMLACSLVVMVFADPLVQVFTMPSDLWGSRDTMMWTTGILCFAAPFIGLRVMTSPIYDQAGMSKYSAASYVVWKIVRVVLFIIALQFSFEVAMCYILFESLILGTVGLLFSRRFLLSNYGSKS